MAKGIPDFKLRRVRVQNFRRLENIDVEIGDETRVLCIVGTNGSGKSSLQSWIIEALSASTNESGPDLVSRHVPAPFEKKEKALARHIQTDEIAPSKSGYAIRTEWSLDGTVYSHVVLVKHTAISEGLLQMFPGFAPGSAPIDASKWNAHGWMPTLPKDDPLAKCVFLVRSPERYEVPSYEESKDLISGTIQKTKWDNERTFPIRVGNLGIALESLLIEMALGAMTNDRIAPSFYSIWSSAYQQLTGKKWEGQLRPWPFRRLGPTGIGTMSGLSAGELDVLVTVSQILAQQLAIIQKFAIDTDQIQPRGFVFIDEIDSHLHPQWQEKVIPLLQGLFPDVFFIVTTHSPFVLRSLPKGKSLVLRLPDGQVFRDEFSAWPIENILKAVFEIPSEWGAEIQTKLTKLEQLAREAGTVKEAIELYNELSKHDSEALRAECRRISALFGSKEFEDAIATQEKAKHQQG